MIETTDTYQQLRDAVSPVFDADNFIKLTEQAFAGEAADLEFELRQERIAPYLVDVTKPLPEVHPLISIGGVPVCTAGNISTIVGEAKRER